ncbi:potassium/proton antiporter [Baaleninema simplex]|uniref:potassium/proton antiporter n=1 Tax=Baaleninema simplex TaxID=2862350 RepID=UPI0035C90D3C
MSVYASKLSSKIGIPALLLFLFTGMIAGSEGIGGIYFDNHQAAKVIGDIALIFILFSGGLDTQWKRVRPILLQGTILATVGVALTMLTLGTFAWFILRSFSNFQVGFEGISWLEGLLLGAIVSSTDAAAVFSMLKSSNIKLKGNLQPLLELESGSNDPMAVLLTTTLVKLLSASTVSIADLLLNLLLQIIVGILVGYGMGIIISLDSNRLQVDLKGLYSVATIAKVLLTYGIATLCLGNGFLAVYVAGVVAGSRNFSEKERIVDFHDGLSWLMQITMFSILGLLVFPSQLLSVAGVATVIAVFLIVIARPLSVSISLALFSYDFREKGFISWVGLRGSVPIILSIIPISVGLEDATTIFNLVFFIVLISVAIQGFTLVPMAQWLGVVKAE